MPECGIVRYIVGTEVMPYHVSPSMPVSFRIDESGKRIHTRAEGVLTFEELLEHENARPAKPKSSYPEIFDCTGATTNLTAKDIRALVERCRMVARGRPSGPVAVIAPTDHFYGLFRMFGVLTSDIRPLGVFRTRPEAEAWLDSIAKESPEI